MIDVELQKDFNASQSTIGLMASISTLMLAAFTLGGGTLGNYQAAFTTGVTQMMLVLAITLLLAAVLVWFGLRSERMAR